jgi:hypothetical protein
MLGGDMKTKFTIKRNTDGYEVQLDIDQLSLIYDALNDYPQWNDDEDDNPTSVIMSKLYNLIEVDDAPNPKEAV